MGQFAVEAKEHVTDSWTVHQPAKDTVDDSTELLRINSAVIAFMIRLREIQTLLPKRTELNCC